MKYSFPKARMSNNHFSVVVTHMIKNEKLLDRTITCPDFFHSSWQDALFMASSSLDFFSPSGILSTCREINS